MHLFIYLRYDKAFLSFSSRSSLVQNKRSKWFDFNVRLFSCIFKDISFMWWQVILVPLLKFLYLCYKNNLHLMFPLSLPLYLRGLKVAAGSADFCSTSFCLLSFSFWIQPYENKEIASLLLATWKRKSLFNVSKINSGLACLSQSCHCLVLCLLVGCLGL